MAIYVNCTHFDRKFSDKETVRIIDKDDKLHELIISKKNLIFDDDEFGRIKLDTAMQHENYYAIRILDMEGKEHEINMSKNRVSLRPY